MYRLPIGPIKSESGLFKFYWRELEQSHCRIIHSHFAGLAIAHATLRRQARSRLQCSTVTSFYGCDLGELEQGKHIKPMKKLLDEENGFVVEGPRMGERLVATGCDPKKIYVNALGVDLSVFPAKVNESRSSNKNEIRALTVGRFVEKKGIIDAISAVVRARRSGLDIKLTIVGSGELQTVIENAITAESAGSFIELFGNASYATLISLYYSHDILLQPSVTGSDGDTEGGAPVSVIEGMAAGLPVVATRHADIPNVVVEGKNALLADEHQVKHLSNALRNWEQMRICG